MYKAMIAYNEWGANTKVKQLTEEFTFLTQFASGLDSSDANTLKHVDIQTVLHASQALSGEINFDNLLDQLMLIMIKSAGAQNIYYIANRDKNLVIEAKSLMENDNICELSNQNLDNVPGVSKIIVNKALRSKRPVIVDIDNATPSMHIEHTFNNLNSASLMCMPILSKDEVIALIYMDNRYASSVFTSERLELLNMLSGQISISIENAALYENLEERVRQRTQTIEKQKEEIEAAKQQSEKLLLNILPEEIAEELKMHGKSAPRRHDQVTIMFTDFEKFTQMSEAMTPEELVEIVDFHYKAFDRIMQKHQIEKIKTIGDSYMCVSGLPQYTVDHAKNAVLAAKEIIEVVNDFAEKRKAKGLPYCEIRIGMHTGAVVAGVVGHIKFAYDIWGDAVNTASRIESAGAPGKINISESTYALIKDDFECDHRGEVAAKNKGKINMYFLK
jgi:class 3 adenylate cyclase